MEGWTTGSLAFMHGISRCQLLWIARSHRTGRCPHGVGDYARSPPDDLASPPRPPRQARASRGHGTARAGRINASTRPPRLPWPSAVAAAGLLSSRVAVRTAEVVSRWSLIAIACAIFATVFFCIHILPRHHCHSLLESRESACHETLCLVSLGLTVDEIDVSYLIASA